MSKNGMEHKRRKRTLRYLFKLHNGQCTKCKCEVVIAGDGLASGLWVWYVQGKSVRYHRTSEVRRIATIEHIIPRCKGGTHAMTNLTLLCSHCNYIKGARLAMEGQGE